MVSLVIRPHNLQQRLYSLRRGPNRFCHTLDIYYVLCGMPPTKNAPQHSSPAIGVRMPFVGSGCFYSQ